MNIFEAHNKGLKADPDRYSFHEQWVSGTYIVTGVFPKRCQQLTLRQLQNDIPPLFDVLRKNKKAWWPKGICAYYSIPIYISEAFEQSIVDWVHSRPKYKWAMWHEPVLYDRIRNQAEMNQAWGVYCSAFRVFLFEVIFTALRGISRKEGHSDFPRSTEQR